MLMKVKIRQFDWVIIIHYLIFGFYRLRFYIISIQSKQMPITYNNYYCMLAYQKIIQFDRQQQKIKNQKIYEKKISKRLQLTLTNNNQKQFLNKLSLRNCRQQDQIPLNSCILLTKCIRISRIKDLDLSQMDLRYLTNLPDFPSLTKLNLTMNLIADKQIPHLIKFVNLQVLYLTQNYIKDKVTIDLFRKFPKLKQLDLSANPVQNKINNSQMFGLVRTLKIYNRYLSTGRDLQRNDYMEQSEEEQSQSQEESVDSDQYEKSNLVFDEESQDEKAKYFEEEQQDEDEDESSGKMEEQQSSESMQAESGQQMSSENIIAKKVHQMSNQQLKAAYQESKRRLKKLLQN